MNHDKAGVTRCTSEYAMPQILLRILDVRNEYFQMIILYDHIPCNGLLPSAQVRSNVEVPLNYEKNN